MHARAAVALGLIVCAGCTSFWQQRREQAADWDDGDDARVEVWLREGTVSFGQPWMSLLDVLGTPVLWIADVDFAWSAMQRDDARIAGGLLGLLVSFLPFYTCVPLDAHPSSHLDLGTPLRLSADARRELSGLNEAEGVEWLARHCAARSADPERTAEVVRWFVAGVRLVQPAALGTGEPGPGR